MENYLKLAAGLIIFIIFVIVGPRACTQPDKTESLLTQQGYSEIKITGWRPFMASDSDSFSTGFEAKSPNGQKVTGAVTGGWFKGSTVRFD